MRWTQEYERADNGLWCICEALIIKSYSWQILLRIRHKCLYANTLQVSQCGNYQWSKYKML